MNSFKLLSPGASLAAAAIVFLQTVTPLCLFSAEPPPNFLVIFTDDQGLNDVGCYGSEIATPNIDSLARDGMKFTSWYVASSICTPSRFGLLTGMNPSRSHDRLLGALMFLAAEDKTRGLQPQETTIATALRTQDYHTALIGKWHLGHGENRFMPHRHGFDYSYGHMAGCIDFYTMSYGNDPDWYRNGDPVEETGYATDLITEDAVRFLARQKNQGRPFYLHLAYNAPHFGKGWDDGNDQVVNIMQPHPDDLARVRDIDDPTRQKFAAKVIRMDDGIGRVLEALDDNGLRDNTLVIFMTDHGGDPNYGGSNLPFRGGKATLFEGGIRVPCLMRWPKVIQPGQTTEAVASALDLFPTFCNLAGVNTSTERMDGKDISPVLRGRSTLDQRELFWELGQHQELNRGSWIALRRGDWKYVRTPDDRERLFHLANDPHEQTDLGASNADRLGRLRERSLELVRMYRGH